MARHLTDYAREAEEAEQKLKGAVIAALDESDIDRAKAIMRRWLKKSVVDVAASL